MFNCFDDTNISNNSGKGKKKNIFGLVLIGVCVIVILYFIYSIIVGYKNYSIYSPYFIRDIMDGTFSQKIDSWKDELGRNISTHGFRTTFRTYIANETAFDGEIAEFALSHKLKDKAQAAYQQGNLLSKRKVMMQHYSDYTYGELEKKVIQLRAHASI